MSAHRNKEAPSRAVGVRCGNKEVGTAYDAEVDIDIDEEGEADGVVLPIGEAFRASTGVSVHMPVGHFISMIMVMNGHPALLSQ